MLLTIRKINLHEIFAIVFLFLVYNPVSYARINPLVVMSAGIMWLFSAFKTNPKAVARSVNDKIFIVSLLFPLILLVLSLRSDVQFEKRCLMEPIFVLFFLFYVKAENRKAMIIITDFLIGYIIIISLNTIFMLGIDPDISRMMAGSSRTYGNFITGGYGTVYLLVLLTTALFSFYLDNKHCKWRILTVQNSKILIICLLFTVFIIRSRYTTAILILVFGMTAEFIGHKKERRLVFGIIMGGGVLFLLFQTNALSPLLMNLSMWFPEGISRNRIHQLADVILNLSNGIVSSKASFGSLQRVDLYLLSFNTIRENWVLGVGNLDILLYGGHMTFLDAMAKYGIFFGGIYISTRVYVLYAIATKFLTKYRVLYKILIFLFIILSFLNITDDLMILSTMFILIPFLCYLRETEKNLPRIRTETIT